MTNATMEDAQARLPELLDRVAAGDGVIITRDGLPVARLVPETPRGMPVAGRAKGMLIIHSENDEHLADFAEYMS